MPERQDDSISASMSFGDHLEELRRRLTAALLGVLPIFIVATLFGQTLLTLVIEPARLQLRNEGLPDTLQATSPMEAFNTYFKIAVIVTIIVGVPWILYQIWLFVAPGLYDHEKRFVRILLPMSLTLSVVGVAFLYKVILPVALAFLIHFSADLGREAPTIAPEIPANTVFTTIPVLAGDPPTPAIGQEWFNTILRQKRLCVGMEGTVPVIVGVPYTSGAGIVPQYKVSEYVDLVLTLALAFAAGFQMPVVVLLLGWLGLIDRKWLAKYRRHALMICVVLSALLTPGDPLSLVLMAIPLFALYELGGLLLKWMPATKVAQGWTKPWKRAKPAANTNGQVSPQLSEEELDARTAREASNSDPDPR